MASSADMRAQAAGRIRISVVGPGNTGKSTLLNALMNAEILPSSQAFCTASLTYITPRSGVLPVAHFPVENGGSNDNTENPSGSNQQVEEVLGAKSIRKRINELNKSARERGKAAAQGPQNAQDGDGAAPLGAENGRRAAQPAGAQLFPEIAVVAPPRDTLADLGDGGTVFIDVPGCGEAFNSAVGDYFRKGLQLSHIVLVTLTVDMIGAASLGKLLADLERDVPHLLQDKELQLVGFVINKCDAIPRKRRRKVSSTDDMDIFTDSEEERERNRSATQDLRAFLRQLSFPKADQASIFELSAQNVLFAEGDEFEWSRFEQYLLGKHTTRKRVLEVVKMGRIRPVVLEIGKLLDGLRDQYPERAGSLLQHTKSWKVVVTVSVASLLVASRIGGIYIASAYSIAAAAGVIPMTAAAAAVVSAAWTDATVGVLLVYAGTILHLSEFVGAHHADKADRNVNFQASSTQLEAGNHRYTDTQYDEQGRKVYVGEFIDKLPHGEGTAYWAESGVPAMKGTFEMGQFTKGYVISKDDVVLGCIRRVDGEYRLAGWQPDLQLEDEEEDCRCCMEQPALIREGWGLDPCYHAGICRGCAEIALAGAIPRCPDCRQEITGMKQIILQGFS